MKLVYWFLVIFVAEGFRKLSFSLRFGYFYRNIILLAGVSSL